MTMPYMGEYQEEFAKAQAAKIQQEQAQKEKQQPEPTPEPQRTTQESIQIAEERAKQATEWMDITPSPYMLVTPPTDTAQTVQKYEQLATDLRRQQQAEQRALQIDANIQDFDLSSFRYTTKTGEEKTGKEAWETYKEELKENTQTLQGLVKDADVRYIGGAYVKGKTPQEIAKEYQIERFVERQEEKRQERLEDRIADYRQPDGSYDLVGALSGGIPEITLQSAKFTSQDISNAKQYIQEQREYNEKQNEAWETLEPYRTKDGYLIGKYIWDKASEPSFTSKTGLAAIEEAIEPAINTLLVAGFTPEQIAKARADAFAEPGEIRPETEAEFEKAKPNIAEEKLMAYGNWRDELVKDLETSREGKTPTEQRWVTAGSGLLLVAIDTVTAIPLMATKIISSPTPATVYEIGKGMVQQVKDTGSKWVAGAYDKPLASGDASKIVYDTAMSYLIVHGGVKGTKWAVNKVTLYVSPKAIPVGSIAKEASTGRIPNQSEYTMEFAKAMNEVERLAMTKGGEFTQDIPIEGTSYKLRILKTPMEQVVGDILWHGTKDAYDASGRITPSLLKAAEAKGRIKSGEYDPFYNPESKLLYTDPWAAVAYSRGENPGLFMIITDSAKLKSGELAFTEGLSKSEGFIRGAKEGFYGSSKGWKGEFETEIVAAPKTKINIPEPTADLPTRMLVGDYADFFTYDAGKYIPIKVGVDASLKGFKMPTASDFYAVKLYSLYNAIRDASEAIKHPDLVLKDISGTLKAMSKYDPLRTGSAGGSPAMPGVRDVYLITDWGTKLGEISRNLWNKALRKTKSETKASPESAEFRSLLERNMDEVYRANAESLISTYNDVAVAYGASTEAREKFEASYLANLGLAMEASVKSASIAPETLEAVYQDSKRDLPDDYSIASPGSLVIPISSAVTPSERMETVGRESEILSSLSSGESLPSSLIESSSVATGITEVIEPSETSRSMVDRVYEAERYETKERADIFTTESREIEYPEYPSYPESPTPPVIKARNKSGKTEEIAIKPGTVVWVQGRPKGGAMYRIVLPPYGEDNFYATREVPPGYVDEGWTGEGSVKESLQIIGGKPDHNIQGLDLGIAKINITVEGGEPEIEFVSDKDSNTGDRAKTVGMGIGQIPIEEWEEAKAQGIEYQEFIREYSGRRVGERQEVKQEASRKRLQEIYDLEGEVMPDEEAWYERAEPVVKTAKVKKKPVEPSLGENIYFGRRTLPNQYNGGL